MRSRISIRAVYQYRKQQYNHFNFSDNVLTCVAEFQCKQYGIIGKYTGNIMRGMANKIKYIFYYRFCSLDRWMINDKSVLRYLQHRHLTPIIVTFLTFHAKTFTKIKKIYLHLFCYSCIKLRQFRNTYIYIETQVTSKYYIDYFL